MPEKRRQSLKLRSYLGHLQMTVPAGERTDLICADCGARMFLTLGQYGRYYRCMNHKRTGCTGTLSAHDDGAPKGTPGDKATRTARRRLVSFLEKHKERWTAGDVSRILGYSFSGVGKLSREECDRLYEQVSKPVTRYTLIAADEDPLGLETP